MPGSPEEKKAVYVVQGRLLGQHAVHYALSHSQLL